MSDLLLKDLKKQIAKRAVVVIAGAGVASAATKGKPVATWKGLLSDGIRRCVDLSLCPPEWERRTRAELESGDKDALLSVAEKVSSILGAPRGGEYGRWLRETVGTLSPEDPEVIAALGGLGAVLATTNYDNLIETVTRLPPVTWQDRAKVVGVMRGDNAGVIHFHGFWDRPETVVLSVRSYEHVAGDEHTQAMLRSLLAIKTVLFVGHGAGLRDPNFGALLTWAERVLGQSEHRHYRLVRSCDLETARSEHRPDQRIQVLPYGENHEDLAPFLRMLAPSNDSRSPTSPVPLPSWRERLAPTLRRISIAISLAVLGLVLSSAMFHWPFSFEPSAGPAVSKKTIVQLYSSANRRDEKWDELVSRFGRSPEFQYQLENNPGMTGPRGNVVFFDDDVPMERAKRVLEWINGIYGQVYFVATTGGGGGISIGPKDEAHWGVGQRPLSAADFKSLIAISDPKQFYQQIASLAAPQRSELRHDVDGKPTFMPSLPGNIENLVIESIDETAGTISIKNKGSTTVRSSGLILGSSLKTRTKPDWDSSSRLTDEIEIAAGATRSILVRSALLNSRKVSDFVFGLVEERATEGLSALGLSDLTDLASLQLKELKTHRFFQESEFNAKVGNAQGEIRAVCRAIEKHRESLGTSSIDPERPKQAETELRATREILGDRRDMLPDLRGVTFLTRRQIELLQALRSRAELSRDAASCVSSSISQLDGFRFLMSLIADCIERPEVINPLTVPGDIDRFTREASPDLTTATAQLPDKVRACLETIRAARGMPPTTK